MNMVKRSASNSLGLAVLLFTLSFPAGTQAQLLTENFGVAASCASVSQGIGSWTALYPAANNSTDTMNRWFISAREANTGIGNCGNGCQSNSALNNNTLHISTLNAFDPG